MIDVLDLFSGIGGISLGLERTGGFRTVGFCEIDSYCQKVLKKHWPDIPLIEDVRTVTVDALRQKGIERVDCITAGIPCQPFSVAGRREGEKDDRFLWPEVARCLREIRPHLFILENVPGILSISGGRVFGGILADLASLRYSTRWFVLSAADMGAPHLRKRVFVIAHTNGREQGWGQQPERGQDRRDADIARHGSEGELADTDCGRCEQCDAAERTVSEFDADNWQVEPDVGRVADGIPARVDRLRCLGNAVVPQCAEWIGQMILASW